MAPPPNDDFANAILIAAEGTTTVDITDATLEVGEPEGSDPGPGNTNQTIWYQLVGTGERYMIDLIGSVRTTGPFAGDALDSVLAVYTGTNFGDMVEVASADDVYDVVPWLSFDTVLGVNYWIQAGTFDASSEGSIVFNWYVAEPNDESAHPTTITTTGAVQTVEAQRCADDAVDLFGTLEHVAWFKYEPTVSQEVMFACDGSGTFRSDGLGDPDPGFFLPIYVIAYSGPNPGSLTFIDYDADGDTRIPRVTVSVTAGETYWIVVSAARDDARGPMTLLWSGVTVRLHDPPLWRFFITDIERDEDGRVTATPTLTILDHRATDRTLVYTLNGPAQHSGLLAADDPEINLPYPSATSPPYLNNNTRLIYGLRREMGADPPWVCRFGGIVMQLEDVAADAPQSRYTAFDPWQYLYSRPSRNQAGAIPGERGIVYKDARPSDIALELLENTVAIDGDVLIHIDDVNIEDSEILNGLFEIPRGESVGETWDRLCATGFIDIVLEPVYDPKNDDGKAGNVCELFIRNPLVTPTVNYDAVFGWDKPGNNTVALSRLIDGTQLENVVQFYAGQGGVPVAQQTATDSIATYGVYWAQRFLTGLLRQDSLTISLALAELLQRLNGQRTLTFTPAPERSLMALRDYGLGEYVAVWSSRNFRDPLVVDYNAFDPDFPGASGYQRVYGIPIELDDNGVERVRAVLTSSDTPTG